jgi:signal transduction histidine kinase/ActR/RegA family two-component response regulator
MKLQTKIWLFSSLVIAVIMVADFLVGRSMIESAIRAELERDARDVRAMLMATRRVYHKQFIDSGLPVNDSTIGFLPAHSLSRIAADFPSWSRSGLSFNNVSDRPRNPKNRADADELAAMEWFRQHPGEGERLTEIRGADGRAYYHFTSPIWIEPYCLKCHGDRSEAPPSVARGYDTAYDYRLGDLRGVMSIKLPADSLRERAYGEWRQRFTIRLIGYLTLLVLLGSLIHLLVTRRLETLRRSAKALESGDYAARCPVAGDDEVAALGRSFNAMAAAIERDNRELAEHRGNLEARLAERTHDLVQANAELRDARDAAEAGSIAKSAFLANMSHEIRTPINAITGMAYLMQRDDGLSPRQLDRLDKIDNAAKHLLGIINDILDLSKIEAGKLKLESVPVVPAALLDNVVSMLSDKALAKGLRLVIDAERLPAGLVGDPMRLTQALLNYAGNAVKFTESGTVTLRLRALDSEGERLLVRFEVEDTGPGIDAATCARLFQPFEQADSSTTRNFGGSGLGLAITRRLAELMDGEAGVDSVPGRGSRFWFTARLHRDVAAAEAAPTANIPAEARLRAFAGARLLLVEDDPVNREVAIELLGEVGLACDLAADGLEAVACVERQPYDLILMDMQMPHLDGLEATQRIRGMENGRNVVIVAMTANAFVEDRQRCAEAGMDDFLAKPVNPAALYDMVVRWLDRGGRGPGTPSGVND